VYFASIWSKNTSVLITIDNTSTYIKNWRKNGHFKAKIKEKQMFRTNLILICMAGIILLGIGCQQKTTYKWQVHDGSRPQPTVVTAGDEYGQPPSDAIILFDGSSLAQWRNAEGKPAQWKVENGYMEVVKGTGDILTRQGFGDCQLHIEWASPVEVKGEGQGRGNSGLFFMNKYEVQVLDSYNNKTYPDGQAGSVYGQYPPIVNACRGPGEWQSYDIIFRRPHFDKSGKVIQQAVVTVIHNGVVIQDSMKILGSTSHHQRGNYTAHADKMPLRLQDHGNPVRYRNIWLRELPAKHVP
jgi:hypothetical protein